MKLLEKEVQELKDKKIPIEDLSDQYFITFRNKIEADNVLKLLTENIYSFQELVDRFKSLKDYDNNDPCLYLLLWTEELFEELIQNNRLNKDDLRYLLNRIDKHYEVDSLCGNISLSKYLIDKDILSFKDFLYRHALGHVFGTKTYLCMK